MDLDGKIIQLNGPILILGGSGFIGANIFHTLLKERQDVYGTTSHFEAWRLEGIPDKNRLVIDLLVDADLESVLDAIRPATVLNCVSYGGYAFENDPDLIYRTNFNLTAKLLHLLSARQVACYIHSGSSSEYGNRCAGPKESDPLFPNSNYAVSKTACSNLVNYFGKRLKFPCANLRLDRKSVV